MNPARRRAALRIGGAVISASMLLLAERCAREPAAPGAPPTNQRSPSETVRLPVVAPGVALRIPPKSHPRAAPPPAMLERVGAGPASRAADTSLRGLVAPLPQRNGPSLVAANDVEPRSTPVLAADAVDGTAARVPTPSLQGLLGTVQPREPLLGLADAARPAPPTSPGAAPIEPASPRQSASDMTSSANDNVPERVATGPLPTVVPEPGTPARPQLSSAAPGTPPPEPSARFQDVQSERLASAGPAPLATTPPVKAALPVDAAPTVAGTPRQVVAALANAQTAEASPLSRPTFPQPFSNSAAANSPETSGLAPPATPISGFSDDDELILEIATARRELSGTIIAYAQRGIPYLPLGEITRFLDLPVTVSDGGRYATGWAVDPAHTVTLNLREGTLTVDGVTRKLVPDDAVAFDGELYLRADRFADLFPLTLTTNLRGQSVTVQTRVPFPFEQKLARETARDQLKGRQNRRDGRSFARVATPWQAIEAPLVDTELRMASDTTRGTRAEADLRLGGDLAWLTARTFLSADTQQGLTSARLELGRRDPEGGLLGPLGATGFGLGDVTSTPLAMGPASVTGRGFYLGNASLERASVFDRIELRGDMPDGFEAELYRNNVLIDTASGPDNGQYRFLNVPVEFGLNVFRVVLYGPQGQRRESVRQISVGDGRLSAGELVYAASAVQKNRTLFNLQGRDFSPSPDDGALRTAAELQYGLSGALTGTIGAAVYDRFGQRNWLASAGLRTGMAGMAFKLDLGLASGGARAVGLGLARKLAGFSVTLNHAEYAGRFVDEVRSFSDQPLRRATELAFNGSLRFGGEGSSLILPTNGLVRNVAFADGRKVLTGSLNQTLPLSRSLQLSNLVEFNRTSQPLFGTTTQLRGAFDLASLSRGKTQLRASLGYMLAPTTRIATAAVQVDRRIDDRTTVTASAGHTFEARQDRVGLSAIRRFDRFSLAFDAAYATRPSQYAAMLRLSFSLGRNPLDGRLFMSQPGLASGGAIALHAFRDLNGDGKLDPGEPPLADVRFFAGSENRATDAAGNVLLGKLGDGPRTSVRIDSDSLPDINLAPAVEGVEFAPRAGHIHVQRFAVRALGELDGTALFRTPSGEKGVSGVIVLLVAPDGKTAARTRTGSDGSFWFEKVTPGTYAVQLDQGQAERLRIRSIGESSVTIGRDGSAERIALHLESSAIGAPP